MYKKKNYKYFYENEPNIVNIKIIIPMIYIQSQIPGFM